MEEWEAAGPRHAVRLAPSLLAADFGNLGEACRLAEASGVEALHLDVMDGRFVPNITFGLCVLEAVRRRTDLFLDVHLMTVEPDALCPAFRRAGADGLTVHAEACPHLQRTLAAIRELGAVPGVALNPHTSEGAVEYVWDVAGLILVMTVNPGFGGQAFLPSVTPKVARLAAAARSRGWDGRIEVDGGIGPEVAAEVVGAGADTLVAGSAIFGQPDPVAAARALRAAAARWRAAPPGAG
jgi:ribulose-phosphate 3-epimerase